ncbi:hypothetical protein HDU97_004017 [Phlyctochytrium planicorne]|nr:hypothetical protein HDU97_004017 [Phlyctochytrium planicorne]
MSSSASPAETKGLEATKKSASGSHTTLLERVTGRNSSATLNEEKGRKGRTRSASERSRQKTLCIRICIIVSIAMILFAIIFIPIFITVLLPKLIQDSFANSNLGSSSLAFTEISIHNISEGSALFSMAAKLGGVNIPLNLPFEMTKNSDWSLADYYNDPVTDKNGEKTWKSMFDVKDIPADFYLHNGQGNIGVRNATLNVGNGAALAEFVGGISKVFVKQDASVVPLFRVGIFSGFKVGALNVKPIPVERVINIGDILLASASSSSSPSVPLTTLPLKVQNNGVIASGIKIAISGPGSPVGLHLTSIGFNLQIDSNTIARVTVPTFSVTAGDPDVTIPMNIAINPIGSLNAILAQVNIFGGSKSIGANEMTAKNENGESVGWLDQVLSKVEFRIPFSKLKGNASVVLTNWLLSLFMK